MSKAKPQAENKALYRWSIAARALAAIVGGYAVVSLFNLALPLLLRLAGVPIPDTLVAVLMASFLIWAVIIMAVFHARSVTRAWAWLIGAVIVLGAVVWALLPGAQQ